MRKFNVALKVCAIVALALVLGSGCTKSKDPYASYTQEREEGLIREWLDAAVAADKDIDTTATGLYYIVNKVGTGDNVKAGDTVTVKYIGAYTDGTIFDASAFHTSQTGTTLPYFSADSTYTYIHQSPTSATLSLILGWEEGIEYLSKGGSATFLFPSAKAYGSGGSYSIPPYSPLLFVIDVVDIK
ncbi:MAG: FKBP-type peptidyl-prolyl cis-trans isomerase [Prolixibacteraceae bacterium]|jgi:FKBP-type peptidyl-prolyl cis-trans isomerase